MRTVFLVILLTFSCCLFGQTPHIVDEIVVEGEAVEQTATVNVVNAAEIKALGATTVAEALELVPGLIVRVGGKGESFLRLRGFRQREVAVLINGVPVYSPYDGQIDLSNLPVEAIERIEVVKGASSLLYGSNAMGGVVNIITRKSDGSRQFTFRAEGGNNATYELGTSLQGGVGGLRYLFAGSFFDRDSFRLPGDYQPHPNQGVGNRDNSDKRLWSGHFNTGWDMGGNWRGNLSYFHIGLDKGVPHDESDPQAKFLRINDWEQNMVDMLLDGTAGKLMVKTKVYYTDLEYVTNSFDDRTYTTQTGRKAYTDTLDDYAAGGDAFFRYPVADSLLLKFALRGRHDVHRQQADLGDPWERYTANTFSVPIEGESRFGKMWALTYGVSFDAMKFDRTVGGGSRTISSTNPQVAFLVKPTDILTLRMSASRKSRFPTLRELYDSRSGNPDLGVMKANIYELGGTVTPVENLQFSLVGFYNDVRDLINRTTNNAPYENVDRAVFKGVEVTAGWKFRPEYRFSVAYSGLQALDKSTQGREYIQYRPKHKVDARADLLLPGRLRVDLAGSWVSSQVYYDGNDQRSLDDYTLVDFRVSRRFHSRWEVYFLANNLFDALYYQSAGVPLAGRMMRGGIRLVLE